MFRLSATILFVLLAAGVIAGFFVLPQDGREPQVMTPQPTSAVSPSPVAQPTGTLSPTVGWKIYRNEEYGFEFRYPTTWQFREGEHTVQFGENLCSDCPAIHSISILLTLTEN